MFSPVRNTKVYEQVIEQIKEMMSAGTLKRGDKLPGERDLVEMFKVSRTSIREAIRSLEILGFIECRQGEGNFLKDNSQESLLGPLSLMFAMKESKPYDVLELRKIIEVETAVISAEKIQTSQLRELEVIMQIMKTTKDIEVNSKMDIEFHNKIVRASGNKVTENLLNAISTVIESLTKNKRGAILLNPKTSPIIFQQHQNIYNALLGHNSATAAMAMRKHIDFVNKYIMENNLHE